MTRQFRQHPATIFRRLSDGVVILALAGEPDREAVFLTGSGGDLWDLLEAPRSLDELGTLLAAGYGAEREQVMSDVGPLLDELIAGDLVTDEPSDANVPDNPDRHDQPSAPR